MALIGITGATGFLGCHLSSHLATSGQHRIRNLTRSGNVHAESSMPNVQWFKGDLGSPRDCEAFVRDLEVVLHLAHTNTPLSSDRDWSSDAGLNIIPTLNLLEAIQHEGRAPHVIYPSSGGTVYGSRETRVPFRETDPCVPTSAYGIVKLAIEHYLRLAAGQGWLTAVALRIGNPYGVLLPPERMQGFIGIAVNEILHGHTVPIYGNLGNVRDYVHLSDLAQVVELCLVPRATYEAYNVGCGVGASVTDILELIEAAAGHPIRTVIVETVPAADRLISWTVLDITKARESLGWVPRISLAQGIRDLITRSRRA